MTRAIGCVTLPRREINEHVEVLEVCCHDLPGVLFEGGDPFLLHEVPLALLVKQPEEVVAEILEEGKK